MQPGDEPGLGRVASLGLDQRPQRRSIQPAQRHLLTAPGQVRQQGGELAALASLAFAEGTDDERRHVTHGSAEELQQKHRGLVGGV